MKVTAQVELPEWDDPDGGYQTLSSAVVAKAADRLVFLCEKDMLAEARKIVVSTIKEQVGEIVATVIAAPVRRTNLYGESTGEAVPLREIIVKEAKRWLEVSVNPTDGSPSRHRRDSISRAYYLTRTSIHRELETMYAEEIAAAVTEVRAQIDGKVQDMVREAVKRILNV